MFSSFSIRLRLLAASSRFACNNYKFHAKMRMVYFRCRKNRRKEFRFVCLFPWVNCKLSVTNPSKTVHSYGSSVIENKQWTKQLFLLFLLFDFLFFLFTLLFLCCVHHAAQIGNSLSDFIILILSFALVWLRINRLNHALLAYHHLHLHNHDNRSDNIESTCLREDLPWEPVDDSERQWIHDRYTWNRSYAHYFVHRQYNRAFRIPSMPSHRFKKEYLFPHGNQIAVRNFVIYTEVIDFAGNLSSFIRFPNISATN